jgi:hypothetical protein
MGPTVHRAADGFLLVVCHSTAFWFTHLFAAESVANVTQVCCLQLQLPADELAV